MFSVTTLFVSHSSLPSPLPLHMAKMRKLITVAVCVYTTAPPPPHGQNKKTNYSRCVCVYTTAPPHMAQMRKLITVAVCVHYRGTNKVVVTISFTVLVIFSISSLHFEKNSRWFIKTSPRQTRYSYRTFSTGTCDDKFYCNRKIRMQKMAENLKLKLFYLNLSFFLSKLLHYRYRARYREKSLKTEQKI